MGHVPDRVKLTYQDLLALPDDGLRHELIDGEHHVTPAPGSAHQLIVGNVYRLLDGFARQHRHGVVMLAPFDIVFSPHDVVEPDLIYFTLQRFKAVVGERNARGAPDLAIEVLSASMRRRDEVIKRRLYERFGIAAYWIVDPELESVKIYTDEGGKYGRPRELLLEDDAVLKTPRLPGLELPLRHIFELP